jgi:hypothetical protein
VPWPERPLEGTAELLHLDPGLEAGRVQLVRAGRKQDVDSGLASEARVSRFVTGVARQVLVARELSGIHEQAHDHEVRLLAGRAEEGEVAIVERPHGGNESDRVAGNLRKRAMQLGDRSNRPHGAVASARTR